MNSLISKAAFILSLSFLISACGDETQSELSALSCSNFLTNGSPTHCFQLEGDGSSHPTIEIQVNLQGFTKAHRDIVTKSLSVVQTQWARHNREARNGGKSFATQCAVNKITRDFFPTRTAFPKAHQNKESGIAWAVLNICHLIEANNSRRQSLTLNNISIPKSKDGTIIGSAFIGAEGAGHVNGFININDVALSGGVTTERLAETIFHEWLHLKGFDHPSGYEGTLIREFSRCLMNPSGTEGLSLTGSKPVFID